MPKLYILAACIALAGCGSLDPLTEACNGSAGGVRTATAAYKAGKLNKVAESVVDHSAAVIDGFCHPGAKRPTNLTGAIQAIGVASANIVALHLED